MAISPTHYSIGTPLYGSSYTDTTASQQGFWGMDYGTTASSTTYWLNTGQGLSVTYPQSYAGYGAYGSQGVTIPNSYGDARLQLQRDLDPHSMNINLGARITIERQRVPIMPIWSNWVEEANSFTTSATTTVELDNRVWQTWVRTTPESEPFARQYLTQEALRAADGEFQRRNREIQQAMVEQQREHNEQLKKQKEAKLVAEETAQILLGELIGEEELKVYKATGRILVKGRKHDYLLHKDGKVQRIEKNKIVDLCVYTTQRPLIPDTDNIIGLKLHILADETEFNKTANFINSRVRTGELPRAANA